MRSMLHLTWLSEKDFNNNVHKIFGPYTIDLYDLYTLFIEESSNMTGQLLCFQSDTSLFNIHDAVSRLVTKVNVKATDPCLIYHYTIM